MRRARSSTRSSRRSVRKPTARASAGINQALIDAFFAEAREHDAWFKEGEADARVLFLGLDKTVAATTALEAVRAKVDDYFARCRVAAFDPRALPLLNRKEDDYLAALTDDLSASAEELAAFPLALVAAGRPLPLGEGVNPAHAAAIATFRRDAVAPVLGDRALLTEDEWRRLDEKLAPCAAWRAGQRGARVAGLGIARVRAILASPGEPRLAELIARDKALEPEVAAIENLERLTRYHRDLYRLCTNFVSFKDFYDGGEPAIFQAGTLYLDQRACMLCLPVDDPARHASMAALAGAYLAYVDCVRKATNEKMQIVAAFTAGDSDNLMVGRNGVFYDRKGQDWDATITKIIDNPISVRQAFFAPYKKFVRFIEEQVAKRAAAADSDAHKQLSGAAETAVNLDKTKPDKPAPAGPKIDIGTVAALGVAVGAIGTFLTAIIGYATGVFKLGVAATFGAAVAVDVVDLDAVGRARLRQAAQTKPRADPRRQRLGDQHAREDQRALRRDAHRGCEAAAGLAPRFAGSLRRAWFSREDIARRWLLCWRWPGTGIRDASIATCRRTCARRRFWERGRPRRRRCLRRSRRPRRPAPT